MRHALILGLVLCARIVSAAEPSATGFWKTIDDETKKAKGLVEIVESEGELKAFVRGTFDPTAKTTCDACEGDKKGKPIKDMAILWGVKSTGKNEWGGGRILDPKNGKEYRVRLELQDDGQKLKVRGYIGISLLGRTQYWERTDPPAIDSPASATPVAPDSGH